MIPTSIQNRFKNQSKNRARKKTNKTANVSQEWSQRASWNFPENPRNRSRGAEGRPRCSVGLAKDPQGIPWQLKGHPKTSKKSPKGPNDPQRTPRDALRIRKNGKPRFSRTLVIGDPHVNRKKSEEHFDVLGFLQFFRPRILENHPRWPSAFFGPA